MKRQTIILSVATFSAGLLFGALVLSQIQPKAADAPILSAAVEPASAPEDAESTPVPIGTIGAVSVVEEDGASSEPGIPELAPAEEEPAIQILLARIDELSAGWGRIQADLAELRQRMGQLEQRTTEEMPEDGATADRPQRPKTPEEQRDALLRSGVSAEAADDIVWRRAQVSLDRLELRDEAVREGWLNTARYREEMRKINEQRVSVRDEVGVDAFDRYLFETGQDNRVLVDSIIPGSSGEESGMLPGDVIETYGDQPVFNFRDLRGATSDGERGELVPVTVRRGRGRVELWLPRGPIGIGLNATRVDPRS